MRSISRAAVPLAVTVGLVAASPAAAAGHAPAAKARASGSPTVELIYPTIVRARIARTQRALERATERYESGSPLDAVPTFKVVRRQLAAAWRGAKYVIRTAPPAAPPEDFRGRRRAHASDDPVGPTYATPADTGFAVLSLQHDVAAEITQLVDGSHGAGLNALSRTMFLALNRRDTAIQDIRTLAPPAPPEDLRGRVRARSSQEEDEVVTFDTVMPNTIAQFDDELQAIAGTLTDATDLTTGGRRLLNRASTQVTATKATVNTIWPPIPPED